ncbi:TPA: M48 family peptidase [Candidatus Saccharibacteria bacterium]|nr:M48 family peptidase [Candidatus Saccharibacteria bacterium]HIO87571.1 M48 family peptidase [Candidatus Saccharibacteria bacterium]
MRYLEVDIGGTPMSIKVLKHHWAKKLTMKVNSLGEVTVTIPKHSSYNLAKKFVETNTPWLQARADVISRQKTKPTQNELRQARALVYAKLDRWGSEVGVTWNKVFIRNQSTRWGSCSSVNNLSFNWRVLNLSPELQDYLIVHELAHIKQHNHSKQFWTEVARVLPDYRERKRQLDAIDLIQ